MPYLPEQSGVVSQANSSSTALNSGAVFTGTGEEVSGYANISVFVFADQASAADGLSIQWSTDNTNWDGADVYSIPANTAKVFTFGVEARYFRVVYTNGGTNQGAFRLQTIFHNVLNKPSSHRIKDKITAENDAELDMSVPAIVESRLTSAIINTASSGDNTLVSGTASQTIKVYRILLILTSSTTVTFKDGTTGLTGAMTLTTLLLDFESEPWFVTSAGNGFVMNLGGAIQASGRIWYIKD